MYFQSASPTCIRMKTSDIITKLRATLEDKDIPELKIFQ